MIDRNLVNRHIVALAGTCLLAGGLAPLAYLLGIAITGDVGGPLNMVLIPVCNCGITSLPALMLWLPVSTMAETVLERRWGWAGWRLWGGVSLLALLAGIGLVLLLTYLLQGVLNPEAPLLSLAFLGGAPLPLTGVLYWSLFRLAGHGSRQTAVSRSG